MAAELSPELPPPPALGFSACARLELARDRGERGVDLSAERYDDADDYCRDERHEQPVFNSGCALFGGEA